MRWRPSLPDWINRTETGVAERPLVPTFMSTVVPTPDEGVLKVGLQGDIVHIPSLGSECNKPAAMGGGLIERRH